MSAYQAFSDCAHCIDEETEAQRSEMIGLLGLLSGKSLALNSGLADTVLLEKSLGEGLSPQLEKTTEAQIGDGVLLVNKALSSLTEH